MHADVQFSQGGALVRCDWFSLPMMFECGQAFRFIKTGEAYRGVARGMALTIERRGTDVFFLSPCSPQQYRDVWAHFFDMDTDYAAIGTQGDPLLEEAIGYCRGMRQLNQEPFETLVSFILSANNNMSRIRGIVERLCDMAGREIDGGLRAFPTPEALVRLGEDGVAQAGAGYRAPYIVGASKAVLDGVDLEALAALPIDDARKALRQLPGVGPKVADCVLLFSLGHREAFPVDVWVERVLRRYYLPEGARPAQLRGCAERFSPYAGFKQQALFHYIRCGNLPWKDAAG